MTPARALLADSTCDDAPQGFEEIALYFNYGIAYKTRVAATQFNEI
jgi:hypothetical protein